MKICILSPSHKSFIREFLPPFENENLPDGYDGAPFIGTLIKEFLEMGHSVVAITTSIMDENNFQVKEYQYGNFTWIVVPQRKHSFRFNKFKLGRMMDFFRLERKEMHKQVQRINPDFVHAHWGYEFAHVAYKSNKPYLVTLHDNPYKIAKFSKNTYRFFRLIYAEIILKKLKFKSTVSPYMQKYASRYGGKLKIIPNPVLLSNNTSEISKCVAQKQNSIYELKIFMISNGWDERKNGLNGLLAFEKLKTYFPKAELHLFGYGSEVGGPAEKDSKIHNIESVIFNGPIPHVDLMNQIKDFHVLIHPALEESFGVALIEAMSLGIPCIGGKDSGAVPWVINDSRLLSNVHSPEQIKETTLSCLQNYEEFGNAVFENVRKRFSANNVAKEYLDYYTEIMEK